MMTNDFSEMARDLAIVVGEAYEDLVTLYDPEDVLVTAEELVLEIQRRVEEMGRCITYDNPTEDYDH